MSDRFYTTLTVSGPNAATAEKAAIYAIKRTPEAELFGAWIEQSKDFPRGHYCDRNCGEDVVQIVARVSRDYPRATFEIYVNGDFGAAIQGLVRIKDGLIVDYRSEEIAYGDEPEDKSPRVYRVNAETGAATEVSVTKIT